MPFDIWNLKKKCHFDLQNYRYGSISPSHSPVVCYFGLWNIPSYVFLTFGLFGPILIQLKSFLSLSLWHLYTFRSYISSAVRFGHSPNVISTFCVLYFCHLELLIFDSLLFRLFDFSTFGHFAKRNFDL